MAKINEPREINIKKCTYYCFDDTVNINGFSPKNIKIDKNSFKDISLTKLGMKHLMV